MESFQDDLAPPSSSEVIRGKVGCDKLPLTTSPEFTQRPKEQRQNSLDQQEGFWRKGEMEGAQGCFGGRYFMCPGATLGLTAYLGLKWLIG